MSVQGRSVQPEWCRGLPLQQQSVLFLAARGADGIPKDHLSKHIQRAYRGTVLLAARYGRTLEWGEEGDTFMSMSALASDFVWEVRVDGFFLTVDELPHHFYLHLLHGAEILGYKHPDARIRDRWLRFYRRGCRDLHLTPETEFEMDLRLNDWGRDEWA